MNILLSNAAGGASAAAGAATPADREAVEEAVQALSVLGFPPAAAQKSVLEILKEQPGAAVELLIKEALKRM